MTLTSKAFENKGMIPSRFSGEDQDLSPPLEWSLVPGKCQSFALICEDPDASGFTHWVIYSIPGSLRALPEGIDAEAANQGVNSFQKIGYSGPMPPVGAGPHRYEFTLYALDTHPVLPRGVDKETVKAAIRPHVLAKARLTGTYQRSRAKQAA